MHAARPYTPTDYKAVCALWESQKFPCIPGELLPKTGFIVEGLAAGFLYKTDSGFALLEWLVANATADKSSRRAALDAVIEAGTAAAKEAGHTVVFCTVQHDGLIARYKNHGFTETDKGMTNLVKRVN